VTLNERLWPVTPSLEILIESPLIAWPTCAMVVETPLTKSAGAAGESLPEASVHVAGPL
jgi:hypothetical protein